MPRKKKNPPPPWLSVAVDDDGTVQETSTFGPLKRKRLRAFGYQLTSLSLSTHQLKKILFLIEKSDPFGPSGEEETHLRNLIGLRQDAGL